MIIKVVSVHNVLCGYQGRYFETEYASESGALKTASVYCVWNMSEVSSGKDKDKPRHILWNLYNKESTPL